ncbi:MAG: DUF309 domain-containing protein [Bacteroidota bacterium]
MASFIIISSRLRDILQGIELFNSADFYSAHDFFEELWFESDSNDRLFLQGMVQVSVGCYHLISGNYKGALSQLTKSKEKLSKYPPVFYGIDLKKLINQIELLVEEITRFNFEKNERREINNVPVIQIVQ